MRRVVTAVPVLSIWSSAFAIISSGDVVNVRYRFVPLPPHTVTPQRQHAAPCSQHHTSSFELALSDDLQRAPLKYIHCVVRYHGVREARSPPPRLGPRARSVSHLRLLLD